jgi:Fe-S-cluster containining protein
MAGIYWYVLEKMDGPQRERLRSRLAGHGGTPPCPFLEGDSCSIYPIRPGACRLFIVFGRPCTEGEDAYHSRREDVLTPIQAITDEAFFIMLPFYGISGEEERRQAIKNRVMNARVQNLLSADWQNLARKMEEHDKKHHA